MRRMSVSFLPILSVVLIVFMISASASLSPFTTPESRDLRYMVASKLDPSLLGAASRAESGAQRIVVVARKDPGSLGAPMRVAYSFRTGAGFMAVAFIDGPNLPALASDPDVVRVMPDIRLNYNETRLGPEGNRPQTDMFRLREITGAEEADATYGIVGKGIRVAIVDTGVDFGSPDLQDALARDPDGTPIAFDPDEQGLVLTNTTFAANVTATGAIANFSEPLAAHMPPNVTSNVYVTPSGVYLNLSRNGLGTNVSYWFGYGVDKIMIKEDYKIGNDTSHFIPSKTGLYSFGLIHQSTYYGFGHPYPALVVASSEEGIYDTVYVDLSTAYALWKESFEPDYSFYDEEPHRIGDGTEYLVADYTGDGVPDISAGLLGARVLDIWGVFTGKRFKVDPQLFIWGVREGVPLPGLDPNGTFFGVMFDFYSHGTLCASSVAGRGKTGYDVYDNGTLYELPGVANGVSIIPVKALWFGDVLYAWMWVSGFDYYPENRSWVYTGRHKADVVSNSWGISEWPLLEMGVGYDVISVLESALTLPGYLSPNYPGTVFVHAGGNGGPGFGTVTVSGGSSLAISVGASTSIHWAETVGGEYPAYGGASYFHDDMASWSNRGPNALGEPKPDVVNVGAFTFAAAPVNIGNGTGVDAYELFGGTSLSAPSTAGGVAMVLEALGRSGAVNVDPSRVKTMLMSTAKDIGSPPFVQGAGRVDNYAAVSLALSGDMYRVYTEATYTNLRSILREAWTYWVPWSIENTTAAGMPSKPVYGTSWYGGAIEAGGRVRGTITIENPSSSPVVVEIQPTTLQLIRSVRFDGLSDPNATDPVSGRPAPVYFNLTEEAGSIPREATLMAVRLTHPFETFYNKTAMQYVYGIPSNLLYLYIYDWKDANHDGVVWYNETSLANYAVNWGDSQELTVNNPSLRLVNTPLIGVWETGYWWSLNESIPFTVDIYYYKKALWSLVSNPKSLDVPANSAATFEAVISVPPSANPGVYEGYLTVTGNNNQTVNVPVSFVVPINTERRGVTYTFGGGAGEGGGAMYDNGFVYGSFDWGWRYESGDWRLFSFKVSDSTVNTAVVKILWESESTNIDVYVLDPYGQIVATTTPPCWYFGLPSNWVPGTGVFLPSKNAGPRATILAVPIEASGTYTILIHASLYGGEGSSEPFRGMIELMTIPSGALTKAHFVPYVLALIGVLSMAILLLDRAGGRGIGG